MSEDINDIKGWFPDSPWWLLLYTPVGLAWWTVQAALKLTVLVFGLLVIPFLYKYRFNALSNLPWWALLWANPEDWHGGHKQYVGSLPPWWMKKEHVPLKHVWRIPFNIVRKWLGKQPWEVPVKPWGDSRHSFWRYHARRNPADGLRNFRWLQLWIDREKVWYWTPQYFRHYEPWFYRNPGWRGYVAGQGVYFGLKVQWVREDSYSELKLGFRVEPSDAWYELDSNSARRHLGASFASKLVFKREL